MRCVVDIRPMAQHWLSGMSRDTERYHLYCVIHIIAKSKAVVQMNIMAWCHSIALSHATDL